MAELYADIIVDISHGKLDKTFQYRVPPALWEKVEPGVQVVIPFGNGNKQMGGYVLAVGEQCKFDPSRTKDILGIAKKGVSVEDKMIALAAWMRKMYGSTMIAALKTVLPAKQAVKKIEHKRIERIMDTEQLLSLLGECERKKQVAKAKLLRALLEQTSIPKEWVTAKLGIAASTISSLERVGAIRVEAESTYRNPVKLQIVPGKNNSLTEDQ